MSNQSRPHYLSWLSLERQKRDRELAPHGSIFGAFDSGSASPTIELRPAVLAPLLPPPESPP